MFLFDAIKPKVKKKNQNLFFTRFFSGAYKKKTSFVSFRVRFVDGNKKHYSKAKRKSIVSYFFFIQISKTFCCRSISSYT